MPQMPGGDSCLQCWAAHFFNNSCTLLLQLSVLRNPFLVYPIRFLTCPQSTGMKFLLIIGIASCFVKNQGGENRYYRKDIGMSFTIEKGSKKQRIQYQAGWDFFFWIKNDSTAMVQDIKGNVALAPRNYRISKTVDSSFVKRFLAGRVYKVEKQYYHTIYPLE